jgi:hypothetical protein
VPIRWRLTIFNALAIGAILLLLGVGLFFLLRESLLSGVESTVESRAGIAARELKVDEGSTFTLMLPQRPERFRRLRSLLTPRQSLPQS